MTTKPKLCYFRGRGRMESIRWLLAAGGVEFEEEFIETTEQYEKLQKDGCLLFGQVPMVEIDGMVLTQTRAILSYLAAKYDLYGKDLKETVRINMYADGTLDLMMMTAQAAFKPPEEKEENLTLIVKKAKTRYFPAFEKILNDHGEDFLVGNKFSWADIQLLEAILMVEELDASVLSDFPLLKAFKARISNIPTIKKFLQPGSPRKPPSDSHYVESKEKFIETPRRLGELKEWTDMYTEGMADLNEMILVLPLCPPDQKEAKVAQIKEKGTDCYLPVFEKVLKSHGQDYLVGNRLSRADIHLVELLYYVEELDPSLMANFPLLKALKTRISNLPPVKKFLQPGSQRKPPISEEDLEKARKIFRIK